MKNKVFGLLLILVVSLPRIGCAMEDPSVNSALITKKNASQRNGVKVAFYDIDIHESTRTFLTFDEMKQIYNNKGKIKTKYGCYRVDHDHLASVVDYLGEKIFPYSFDCHSRVRDVFPHNPNGYKKIYNINWMKAERIIRGR